MQKLIMKYLWSTEMIMVSTNLEKFREIKNSATKSIQKHFLTNSILD